MIEEVAYQVKIDVFDGPFDLLLQAIDDGQVDIYRVALAQITAAYLQYWREQSPNLISASDFVVMAAYLVELKSRRILPSREEIFIEEENNAELEAALLQHIQEYEVYKQLAQDLKQRKAVYEKIYVRHEGEILESDFDLVDVSLRDLVVAFQKVYAEAAQREKLVHIVKEEVTLEERLVEIRELLARSNGGVRFPDLFIRHTRLEVVVTFLAILELAKQRVIRLAQDRRFGDIIIVPRSEREAERVAQADGTLPA